MLLRFSCKNFKSFYDEVNIDLTASAIKEHKDSLININNINILPVAAIFGANGSGKSNIFDALSVMRSEVYGNSSKEVRDAYITPFYFESSSRTSPSEFEICIYSEELKKEFRYGFSRNSKEVFEEWLFSKTFSKTPTVKEKLIYYRKKGEKIQSDLTDGNKELAEIQFVSTVTKEDELIITNLGRRNNVDYGYIYWWFMNYIKVINYSKINEESSYRDQYLLDDLYNNNDRLKEIEKIIKIIDPAIDGLVVKKELDYNMNDSYMIYSIHKSDYDKKIEIPFSAESCGTKKMIYLAWYLLYALLYGRTLFIDELDSKLHPLLLRYIVKLFKNKELNKIGGQLIFSSHNLICLDSSDLRRDEIWFIEKQNQKSTMFSLYDFKEESIRKDLDFGKHYLSGRFGAIPFNEEE